MGRPMTAAGSAGKASAKEVERGRWRGWQRYRDACARCAAGGSHMVERYARTKGEALSAVQRAVQERLTAPTTSATQATTGNLRATSTVADAWQDYSAEVLSRRSQATARVYRSVWTKHIEPALGATALADVTEADAERLVQVTAETSGAGAAKTTRTVLLGVLDRGRKARVIHTNPAKGLDRPTKALKRTSRRDKDRALTEAERRGLLALEPNDTTDLIAFLLGTGCRLGEAMALRWESVDLQAGTVAIVATVTRDAGGRTILGDATKTAAGVRVVHMPAWIVGRLSARQEAKTEALVFPAPRAGGLRDLRATNREIRRVLDDNGAEPNGLGLSWATSHTMRRTRATNLLAAGIDPVQVAKVLGHKRASLTLDRYGKRSEDAQALTAAVD